MLRCFSHVWVFGNSKGLGGSLPESSVHRNSENIGVGRHAPPPGGPSEARDRTCVACIPGTAGRFLTQRATCGFQEQPGTTSKECCQSWHHAPPANLALPLFFSKLTPLDCKYRNQRRRIIVTEFSLAILMTVVISAVLSEPTTIDLEIGVKRVSRSRKKKH